MNCPICNAINLDEREKYKEFTLFHCNNCDVYFWYPLKHPGQKFYETSELHEIKGEKKLQWRHKQFLKDPVLKSGKFLDIGCGTGEFLNEVKNLGIDVWGTDIAPRQINFAKERYGFKNIFVNTLTEFVKSRPYKFDAISFFEVLEHLDNPKEFIANVKEILNPSGLIIFSVPNTERVGMGKEPEETPPNHLFRWTKKSITNFLKQENFDILKIVEQPFSKDFFFTTGFFSMGLANRIKKETIKNSVIDKRDKNIKLSIVSCLASVKNSVLVPISYILAIFPRMLGYKYWDLYVVAQLKE